MINDKSLHAKLVNISKSTNTDFQILLNRYGAEQFLARLEVSIFIDRFIFKGGSLLTYLIPTERQTKDLDFCVRGISSKTEDILNIIEKILSISLDDAITWDSPTGEVLNHPDMDKPGSRIRCHFYLGKAKGCIHMDLAFGDLVEARKIYLERIRYKGQPLLGLDFEVLAYPLETIFAEKLQTAVKRAGSNTRMKDYYDMFKLLQVTHLDSLVLKNSIEKTFSCRQTLISNLSFDDHTYDRLQIHWHSFIQKLELHDAPRYLKEVIIVINNKLIDFNLPLKPS